VGKNNKDSQFFNLMKELTPERIAWAYSLTLSDFGSGGNTTYSNVAVFNDALYDKIGKPVEIELDKCRNNFVLKKLYNIPISDKFYVRYEGPQDPNSLLEIENWRNDYLSGLITINEYRSKRDLEPFNEDGDLTLNQLKQQMAEQLQDEKAEDQAEVATKSGTEKSGMDNQSVDHTTSKEGDDKTEDFALKKKSPTEIGLDSEFFTSPNKGLKARFKKAITKQLTDYADKLEKLDNTPMEVILPKLESYYSFNTLKRDLLNFAGIAMDIMSKDKRLTFSKNYFSGEYSPDIIDLMDKRAEELLKGGQDFTGLDTETTYQISQIIARGIANAKSHFDIVKDIRSAISDISESRASLIATTEVGHAIEGSRYLIYSKAFPDGTKEWLTVGDDRVRPAHRSNEAQGEIGINVPFSSGERSPADAVNCRCSVAYSENIN